MQLRHYAFHLAKLAGAAAIEGDAERDFLARRLPDLLLFGLKLATPVNEQLPEQPVTQAEGGRAREVKAP